MTRRTLCIKPSTTGPFDAPRATAWRAAADPATRIGPVPPRLPNPAHPKVTAYELLTAAPPSRVMPAGGSDGAAAAAVDCFAGPFVRVVRRVTHRPRVEGWMDSMRLGYDRPPESRSCDLFTPTTPDLAAGAR
ncbi:hypothetical protein OG948_02340 [Embleya sp. NBC_00888]|uniref:hypothetical protein n=1 Tax=Embleya sp. NBC_00888 TaxID=2975960 RepID=UPI00386861C7|nr:hypothetical protein OG948_02340 [Embleya sp. NBC_00888]